MLLLSIRLYSLGNLIHLLIPQSLSHNRINGRKRRVEGKKSLLVFSIPHSCQSNTLIGILFCFKLLKPLCPIHTTDACLQALGRVTTSSLYLLSTCHLPLLPAVMSYFLFSSCLWHLSDFSLVPEFLILPGTLSLHMSSAYSKEYCIEYYLFILLFLKQGSMNLNLTFHYS